MTLDPAYQERLTLLMEECAEIIQVAAKIMRFGPESSSPVPHPLGQETNSVLLGREIGDLFLVLHNLMIPNNDFDYEKMLEHKYAKCTTINKYLKYNKVT